MVCDIEPARDFFAELASRDDALNLLEIEADSSMVIWSLWKRTIVWTLSIAVSWALVIGCLVAVWKLFT